MQLKKLDPSFYIENTHIVEALDNFDGNWEENKVRGYGIVVIKLHGLKFGIPLRSHIKHKAAYITVRNKGGDRKDRGKGFDFSKALLITHDRYISENPFKIPEVEHNKVKEKSHFIKKSFEKYVDKYISAARELDDNILKSAEYRYTTLKNYHAELKI